MPNNPDIEIQDLLFTHPHCTTPLLRIPYQEFPGSDITVITGDSGSGKTTLLSLLAALLNPDQGKIRIGDLDITALSKQEKALWRRHELGMIFQDYKLLSDHSVLDNCLIANPHISDAKEKAKQLLYNLGLAEKLNSYPNYLSGGEQQRVAMARALVKSPSLILCDEPTGNLDPANAQLILEQLQHAQKQAKSSIIMVSHDPGTLSISQKQWRLHEQGLNPV